MIKISYKNKSYRAYWLWNCNVIDKTLDETDPCRQITMYIYYDEVLQVALLIDDLFREVYTITKVTDTELYKLDFTDKNYCYGNAKHHVLDKIVKRFEHNLYKRGIRYQIMIDNFDC